MGFAIDVLKAADYFMVQRLSMLAELFVINCFRTSNVCAVMTLLANASIDSADSLVWDLLDKFVVNKWAIIREKHPQSVRQFVNDKPGLAVQFILNIENFAEGEGVFNGKLLF